mgnify:CR=1 FL=1
MVITDISKPNQQRSKSRDKGDNEITYDELSGSTEVAGEKKRWTGSSEMREKVLEAVEMQRERYKDANIDFNSQLGPADIDRYINELKELESVKYQKSGGKNGEKLELEINKDN